MVVETCVTKEQHINCNITFSLFSVLYIHVIHEVEINTGFHIAITVQILIQSGVANK